MWSPRVTVAAVIEDQGRFLVVEEAIDGELVLNQPAGHLEAGESLLQAVCRETREETGWVLEPQALVGVYRWQHPFNGDTYLRTTFCGHALDPAGGQARAHGSDLPPSLPPGALDPDIHAVHWLSPEQIRQRPHRSPLVWRCLQDYLAGRRFDLELLVELDLATLGSGLPPDPRPDP